MRQPRYIELVNSAGAALARAGLSLPALEVEQLLRRARARTGLEDFGEPSFAEGLARLVDGLNSEADLSQIGRIAARFNLLDQLCVRLRLIEARRQQPGIAAQRIERPLFIVGMPRTGTTILFELIARDPAFRSPASWEVARPLPPPDPAHYASDPRIAATDRLLRWMETLSPGFRSIHAIGARLPQECVYMMASQFASEQFTYMYNLPSYRAWLLQHDLQPVYRWHQHFLQHLQARMPPRPWVLKSPAHLAGLGELLQRYPDARVVWTHRRPLDALASFSSLATTLRSGFSAGVDAAQVGEQEAAYFSRVVARGMADRDALDSGQFIDAAFSRICRDPLAVVRDIYAHFELPLSAQAAQRMRDYLAQRPRDLYGEHHYSWAGYGLREEQEQRLFAAYMAHYESWLQ